MNDSLCKARELEEGEAWEESDEVVEVEVKRPLDKVIPVRLPPEKWEELRREARERGIGPPTLAREWILEKLEENTLELISVDPNVCHGQACIKGTRIMVSVVLDCLAAGMSEQDILVEYPTLTVEGVRAAAACGAALARVRRGGPESQR